MRLWGDEVELIAITHSSDPDVLVTETARALLANKKDATRNEFYQGYANGLIVTAVFEIHSFEYQGESKLRHEGKEYVIFRTYSKETEYIELVCHDYRDIQTSLAQLRDPVEIWRVTFAENTMGEEKPVPELFCSVMAKIEYRGGGTGRSDEVIETTNNAVVTLVYRPDISSDMFIKINGQRWEIEYIENPLNRNETLQITIKRVIP